MLEQQKTLMITSIYHELQVITFPHATLSHRDTETVKSSYVPLHVVQC